MAGDDNEANAAAGGNPSGGQNSDKSLTLSDYLETATDASRRTRFITIIMVVASVLVLVSVLNSSDFGWISLRLAALSDNTSKYTVWKFPVLCKCDIQVQTNAQSNKFCTELEGDDSIKNRFSTINKIDADLVKLNNELSALKASMEVLSNERRVAAGETPPDALVLQKGREIRDKEVELKAKQDGRQIICNEERERLAAFNEVMLRSAAETKYTVRVPFFGVAFDINDIGFLGGLSLWIILILLRLSLRSQIVSLRIGFKAARASDQERWFYEILAGRQVFLFPFLEDKHQKVSVARGWTEIWWRNSVLGQVYQKVRGLWICLLKWMRGKVLAYLKITEETEEPDNAEDVWRVNRNTSLRIVPKMLSLLPFAIYLAQFLFDVKTQKYGNALNADRTWLLLSIDLFFLLNILVFGLWCVTKWNELDKLWDYFKKRIDWAN